MFSLSLSLSLSSHSRGLCAFMAQLRQLGEGGGVCVGGVLSLGTASHGATFIFHVCHIHVPTLFMTCCINSKHLYGPKPLQPRGRIAHMASILSKQGCGQWEWHDESKYKHQIDIFFGIPTQVAPVYG